MIKRILRKIVLGNKADSDSFIKYLRSKGVEIGEFTNIYNPQNTTIDLTRPWLIKIGKNVQITDGVTILTHGFDWSVLKAVYGDVLGSSGSVTIGDNVFIGVKTTILKGVHIGNNVIIGANSLVNKDIPDNVVAAGNPCKIIMGLDEYHEKRKSAQIKEVKELIQLYRKQYGSEPDENALHEFFWLFTNDISNLPEKWIDVLKLGGNFEYTKYIFQTHKKQFNSMDGFLNELK